MTQGAVKTTGKRSRVVSAKKKAILSAALDTFSQFGFHGTRLEQIAELAGVSKTNLLYYFPSKEALYIAVLRQILDIWLAPLKAFREDFAPLAAIKEYIRLKLEVSRDYPQASRLFCMEMLAGAPLFNFSDGKQPLAMARKSLTEMADLLNLQSAAETHLAQYEDFIRSMKPRFVKRGARPLLLTTLIDPRHMLVFGPNSLFQEILDEYGIPNAWQGETNFWGSTAVSIDRLAAYKDVDVLCFDHDNSKDMDALMATPLWQAMPFVRTGRFQRVPAVWFYGATLSAMHFVRVLDNAIGGKA